MDYGALITAAGMSSRMGKFKPMLSLGEISVAERVVATFRQAGVTRIAMVTGYNARELERHLSGCGIEFIRNEDYETTQMFDSVKLGLEYLKGKCDAVFFTPVDIPLFTAKTVLALKSSGAALACPQCNGESGHPIVISSSLIDRIIADSGEGGLRGALERCGTELVRVSVEDEGTLHDADTPEDFARLIAYHNAQLVRPVVNVALGKEKIFFDDRMASLLTLIKETESVREACQRMQMSYSTAWKVIRTLESQVGKSLVHRSQGGAGGSTSSLTASGATLLDNYSEYRRKVREYADALYKEQLEGFFK